MKDRPMSILKQFLSLPARLNDIHAEIKELRKECAAVDKKCTALEQTLAQVRGDVATQFGFFSTDIEKTLVSLLVK